MPVTDFLRALVAAGVALAAGLASAGLGAPPPAAMLSALIGCVAAWMVLGERVATPVAGAAPEPQPPPREPLVDALDDPLLLIDGQLVTHANDAARQLLGQHIIGEDVRLAIRHPAAADRLGRDSANGGPIQLTGLGERDRRWEMLVRELPDGARLVRLRDITGAYVAERMRVDFVANASHELRTPLATLVGFLETLQEGPAAEDVSTRSRFLKIMFDESKRMQRLVDDLISLSRIEADKFRPPQAAVDLAELVAEVAHAAGRHRTDRPILLDADKGTEPVAGDRAQLSQLLHNLISNALKYGREETPVRVSLAPAAGKMTRISVSDEGEGIPPEHLPRLTERFYRVDPGRSRELGGTGLGLAIVKHIVERHRGRLDIVSEVGRGTTVSVLLPQLREPVS